MRLVTLCLGAAQASSSSSSSSSVRGKYTPTTVQQHAMVLTQVA
jgi:hypothetical protein